MDARFLGDPEASNLRDHVGLHPQIQSMLLDARNRPAELQWIWRRIVRAFSSAMPETAITVVFFAGVAGIAVSRWASSSTGPC